MSQELNLKESEDLPEEQIERISKTLFKRKRDESDGLEEAQRSKRRQPVRLSSIATADDEETGSFSRV